MPLQHVLLDVGKQFLLMSNNFCWIEKVQVEEDELSVFVAASELLFTAKFMKVQDFRSALLFYVA